MQGWHFSPGLVEGRPAAFAHIYESLTGEIAYFVLIEWKDEKVIAILDFAHACYAARGADCIELELSDSPRLESTQRKRGPLFWIVSHASHTVDALPHAAPAQRAEA